MEHPAPPSSPYRNVSAEPVAGWISALVHRLTHYLIRAEAGAFEASVAWALQQLGEAVASSSAYLYEFDINLDVASKLHEWRNEQIPSTREAFTQVNASSLPTLFPRAARGEVLRVDKLSALDQATFSELAHLRRLSIEAFLAMPVMAGGRLVGLLGFDQHAHPRQWTDEEVTLLRLAADLLGQFHARRQAEDRHDFHTDNAPLGIIEWDEQWRVRQWSAAAERIFGWTAAEQLGKNWNDWHFVCEEDLPAVEALAARLIAGDESSNISINRNFDRQGQTLVCEWFNSVQRDRMGGVVSVLSFVQDVTERERTRSELQQSQQELQTLNRQLERRVVRGAEQLMRLTEQSDEQARALRALLEVGPDHVFLLDQQHRCRYVGRAALDDLDRSSADLTQRTAAEAGLPPPLTELFDGPLTAVFRTATGRVIEADLETVRGRRRFEYTLTPVSGEGDDVVAVLCNGHDVTNRNRAAQALQESEERYRTLAEHATDMITVHDQAGVFTYVSPACRQLLGYEPQELLGRRPFYLLHEDDFDAGEQRLRQIADSGEVIQLTYRARRKDGNYIWLESSSRGDDQETVVVSRDVTERIHTEQQLQLVQSAINQVREAVVITDAELRYPGPLILYVNPTFCEMTGYSAEEVLGRSPRILQGPNTDPATIERLRQALRDKQSFSGETVNYRKDGSEYIVEWNINAVRDPQGRILNWVSIQRDITARKSAEQIARAHREELAHVTRLSTMGEMASGLAHEINQPLTAICNYLSGITQRLAGDRISGPELHEALQHVVGQAERAGQIIRRLRSFVTKRGSLREPEKVNELIRETLAFIDMDLREHQVQCDLDLEPNLPPVNVDGVQIEQVLINLVRNAAEAMAGQPPETRRVVISTRQEGSSLIRVSVADRGPGLSLTQRDHLFAPFFTTKAQGMGMGLTISQSIVESHEGRLWVDSSADSGCIFHFTLPAPGKTACGDPPSDLKNTPSTRDEKSDSPIS